MAKLNYATEYLQTLEQMFPYVLYFGDLFATPNNGRYRWVNSRVIEVPTISTTGRTDGDRDTIGTRKRNYNNEWKPLTLENHRQWQTLVHPRDIAETKGVVAIGNITKVYNEEQKFPEMNAYCISKLYADWTTDGAKTAHSEALTEENVLTVFDEMMKDMDNKRVPRAGRILYVTPDVRTLINNAKQIYRRLKKIVIGIPKAKTEYVSVPGMNGDLDLSEAQNGGVKYEMRTLKFTFGARNCSYERWSGLLSQIASDLQGISKRIILDTDKGYYYTGRCEIETEKNNDVTAEIVISCKCEPYKISVDSSDEPWKWDTFSFINGVIRNTSEITISSGSGWQKVSLDGWVHNETLRIVSNAEMKVRYRNSTYTIYTGENIMYDIVLYKGANDLYFQGTGKVTLIHRGGML